MSLSLPRNLLAPAVIALGIACGLALSRLEPAAHQAAALEWLGTPQPVAAFQLASDAGAFSNAALQGHWQLLLLGFTQCPDICPATLSDLAALQRALPASPPRIVFVSVDPVRDTPQQLAQYVRYFGADVFGVTGDDSELRRLAHSLGMDFRREGDADAPTISHSPTIALIGPDGTLRARLRPGFDAQQAARELAIRMRTEA